MANLRAVLSKGALQVEDAPSENAKRPPCTQTTPHPLTRLLQNPGQLRRTRKTLAQSYP